MTVKRHRGHLVSGKLEDNNKGHIEGKFIIDLPRREDFRKVLKDIRQIKAVITLADITDSYSESELT